MRHAIVIAIAAFFGACSSIRQHPMVWEPATVRLTARIAINVYKANGDCEELVTLEAIVISPNAGEQEKAYFRPWGVGTWEEGKLYEVEIGRQLPSRNEAPRKFIRQRPDQLPRPAH